LKDTGVAIKHDQADRCFYRGGATDEIHMVPKEGFETAHAYYAVALHEVGHSTGHESRLNREMGNIFGSEKYAIEELRAEMASYMLTTELGLGHNPERHAPYIKSWMSAIKADKNILFQAARDAEKITEWVLDKDKRLEMAKEATMGKEAQEIQKEETKSLWQKSMSAAKGLFTRKQSSREKIEEWVKQLEKEKEEERQRQSSKHRLDVPDAEKNQAKAAGAIFDEEAKEWYFYGDTSNVAQWVPKDPYARTYLHVPQAHRNKVRKTNAQYDQEKKSWYIIGDVQEVQQWLPTKENILAAEAVQAHEKVLETRLYLEVPFSEQDQVKEAGGKWDKDASCWYIDNDSEYGIKDSLRRWHPNLIVPAGSIYTLAKDNKDYPIEENIKIRDLISKTHSRLEGLEIEHTSDHYTNWSNNYRDKFQTDMVKKSIENFTPPKQEQPLEQSSNIKDEFTEDFEAWKVNINKFMDDNPTIPFDYPQAQADWFKERIEDPLANDPEDFKKKYPIAYQNIINNEAQRKAEREQAQAQTSRVYLDVPYMERKTAKAAGAKWDTTETKWYVEGDTSRVQKWLPEKDNELARQAAPTLENKPETTQEKQQPLTKDRQYLNVPFDEKSEAKIAGAKWDRTAKSWYAPEGVAGLDRWKPENTKTPVQTISPAEEFKQALQDHGIIIKGLPEMDGNWHRVALEDDSKGKQSGSYRGFLDGVPNGQIKNFKDGQDAHQWVSTGSQMSEAERIEYKREIEIRKAEREAKLKEQHKEVAKVAYGRIVNI
jgi:putative DNA primase/helicase